MVLPRGTVPKGSLNPHTSRSMSVGDFFPSSSLHFQEVRQRRETHSLPERRLKRKAEQVRLCRKDFERSWERKNKNKEEEWTELLHCEFWVLPALIFSVFCVCDYTAHVNHLSRMHIHRFIYVYVFIQLL